MVKKNKHTGFAIAIAWPQTYCKQPGSWYDGITTTLGANKNNYYKAGHAALVLVNINNKTCHYFDFGRYHTPFQHGRVRSALTDCELTMKTKPQFSDNCSTLTNFTEIITELQNNKACHGEGEIHASYTLANFEKAISKANKMQQNSPIPYGPFKYKGSNCSRFVNKVLVSGTISLKQRLRLNYIIPLTPTPLSNVNTLKNRLVIPKLLKTEPFYPAAKLPEKLKKSTLIKPVMNKNIPQHAQWLSGEGVGSWFAFSINGKFIEVTRYATNGKVECSGFYKNNILQLPENGTKIEIQYPSNCQVVTLKTNSKILSFKRVDKLTRKIRDLIIEEHNTFIFQRVS